MRITAFCIAKGGTGKTISCISLAEGLKEAGKKVLVIDADPQGTAGALLGVEESAVNLCSLMTDHKPLKECINHTGRVDLIPGGEDISSLEGDIIASSDDPEKQCKILRNCLRGAEKLGYTHILIDCAPTTGNVLFNVLSAADDIIVPLLPDGMAMRGMHQLLDNVDVIKGSINNKLHIAGVLITQASRTAVCNAIIPAIQEQGEQGDYHVFKAIIPKDAAVGKAYLLRESLFTNTKSKAATAYHEFVNEYLSQE